jgi:hypothetical protein
MVATCRFGYYGNEASIKDVCDVFIISKCAINLFTNQCNIVTFLFVEY